MTDASTEKEIAKLVSKGLPQDVARAVVLRQKGLISEKEFTRVLGYV